MKTKSSAAAAIAIAVLVLFAGSLALETSAWARAGGGSSSGSRGSRSFSSPAMPSRPSPSPSPSPSPFSSPQQPGYGAPGAGTSSRGWFGGSSFMQGLAGGVAGGLLGNMLFGSRSYGSGMGGFGGSGIGLFDILIIGGLIYFGMKYFRRRRAQQDAYYEETRSQNVSSSGPGYFGAPSQPPPPQIDEVQSGINEIRRFDPSFTEESFKEAAEDMFFRIQASWMNRSLEGIENMVTPEMAAYFQGEFAKMKREGRINRLENIAVRKVEPSEVWQESGRDFITVFFTANLLDYTVDDQSGQVVLGDKLNPVKFQEFWTFCRNIGTSQWQLTAINQIQE